MNNSFKIIFHLRKPKLYASGPYPVYLRITIEGQRWELTTQRECIPNNWNTVTGRQKGNNEAARVLNIYLDSLVSKIYACRDELIRNGIKITAENIKNKYTGVDSKIRMLLPIFEQHNDDISKLVGKEFASATFTRYQTTKDHVINFMKSKYGISDIDIKKLNHEFIIDFNFYLRTERNCNNNTAVKYIRNLSKIIRMCLSNGWIDRNPFLQFKLKVKEVKRVFLSEEELQFLLDKNFSINRINEVKDMFLFSCFTGLAYVDAKNLTTDNLIIAVDGNKWIHTHRKKTDTPSHIPLLPHAVAIIEKYKKHPKVVNTNLLLPLLSNQKMNAYLKEIADLSGITKDLTFHIARHTFATTVTLSNNIPIESVSKMLGHKSIRTTQHYAKILDKKVGMDMNLIMDKY